MESTRVKLSDVEQRILGVLIEKSLTQPDSYPLTFNSLQLGANQKQNRDPVREYSDREISEGLRGLELKKLVTQAPPALGARSVRFQHHAVELFSWDRREQAVMAELMLRGRQTAGELRTHAGRMTPFADLEAIQTTLTGLCKRDAPFAEELPREPGRSANRFRHLMSSEQREQGAAGPDPVAAIPAAHDPASNLETRVAQLETAVSRLQAQVAMLQGATKPSIDEASPPGV